MQWFLNTRVNLVKYIALKFIDWNVNKYYDLRYLIFYKHSMKFELLN